MFWPTPLSDTAKCDASTWRPLAVFLLWFIVFTVLFWLIYFSIKPTFVLNSDNQVDVWLVLVAAMISALVVEIVVMFIKWVISSR